MTRQQKEQMIIEMLQPKHEYAMCVCKEMVANVSDDTVKTVYAKWQAGEYNDEQFETFWALEGWL